MTDHDGARSESAPPDPAMPDPAMPDPASETDAPAAETGAARPSATPSPRAQAASRARRIGGRPLPSGAPHPSPAAPPEPPAPTSKPSSVELAKRELPDYESSDDLTAAAADTAPDTAAADTAQPRRARPWLNWLPTGLLAAAIVAVLTIGVLVSHGTWWDKKTVNPGAQRGQVVAAAKSCMATMNSYEYNKLDAAEAKGLACTTGQLSAQYKSAMEKVIKPQATKVKFTQSAQVNNAGIESVSKDGKQWVILVFGQLATTDNTTTANSPKLSIFSARVTMQQVKGHWLVANYQYAPNS